LIGLKTLLTRHRDYNCDMMKVGDLVKMKYAMWWRLRGEKAANRKYTEKVGVVMSADHNAIKVLLVGEDHARVGLKEEWEIINESR